MDRSATFRRLLLGTAPLALAAGILLRVGIVAPSSARITLDREQAIERARQFAQTLGITPGSRATVKVVSVEESRIYNLVYPDSPITAQLLPPYSVDVSFTGPEEEGVFKASLTPGGRLLGFDTGASDAGSLSDPDARARAEKLLQVPIPAAGVPGVRLRVEASARGDRLVRLKIDPDFDDAFRRREISPRKTSRQVVGGFAFALIAFTVVYSLVLFRRRSREQEVPRERLQLLVAVYGVVGVLYVVANFDAQLVGSGTDELGLWLTLVIAMFSAVFFFLAGLLLAVAYAGGEGEIREGYPGKLTSFDAVIAGKPWSRNAGLSVVSGAACAAWAFFLLAVVARLSAPASSLLVPEALLSAALGRMPLAGLLLRQPILVTWTVISGLLVPSTFFRRRALRPRARTAWLLFAPFLIGLGFSNDGLSATPPFAEIAIGAMALVLPFIQFDLLAAITSAILYHLLSDAALLAPVIDGWGWIGGAAVALSALALIPFLRATRSGLQVSDEEVAPRYVANLERRLSLQAEVGAARLAQMRLLPHSPPPLPGLSVAATCLPAGEVGGDFYDFYPLASGELALFVASASGSNVASALTIALAKGFLVCDLRRADGPEATLGRLRDLLLQSLGPAGNQLALALAIIDPRRSSVRAARVGSTPELWLLRRDGSLGEMIFAAPAQPGVTGALALLAPGDALLVHTEGLVRLLEDQSPSGVRDWMRSLAGRVAGAAVIRTQEALLDRLGGRKRKRLSPARLQRDLTAAIVRFEGAA